MCWNTEFVCLGFEGQDFSTLTSAAAAVVIGTAGECGYRQVPESWRWLQLYGSAPWLSKQRERQALLRSPAAFLRCPSRCCLPCWQLSRGTGQYTSGTLRQLFPAGELLPVRIWGEESTDQPRETSPQESEHFSDPPGESCVSRFSLCESILQSQLSF